MPLLQLGTVLFGHTSRKDFAGNSVIEMFPQSFFFPNLEHPCHHYLGTLLDFLAIAQGPNRILRKC